MTRRIALTAPIALALVVGLPAFSAGQTPPPAQKARPGVASDARPVVVQPKTHARVLPQGFSVVLVLADLEAAGGQDDVPPAARKALTDMKDFLPYKSYRLLDAAWLLGQATTGNTTRLRGLEEHEYELRLHTQPTGSPGESRGGPGDGSSRVFVRFTLNDGGAEEFHGDSRVLLERERQVAESAELQRQAAAVRAELNSQRAELEKKRKELGAQSEEIRAVEKEVQRLQGALAATARASERRAAVAAGQRLRGRAVIDTSFTMDVGETVVVGTSRLKGDGKALIALLTAVPPKGRM